jgi:hypothetical protein
MHNTSKSNSHSNDAYSDVVNEASGSEGDQYWSYSLTDQTGKAVDVVQAEEAFKSEYTPETGFFGEPLSAEMQSFVDYFSPESMPEELASHIEKAKIKGKDPEQIKADFQQIAMEAASLGQLFQAAKGGGTAAKGANEGSSEATKNLEGFVSELALAIQDGTLEQKLTELGIDTTVFTPEKVEQLLASMQNNHNVIYSLDSGGGHEFHHLLEKGSPEEQNLFFTAHIMHHTNDSLDDDWVNNGGGTDGVQGQDGRAQYMGEYGDFLLGQGQEEQATEKN